MGTFTRRLRAPCFTSTSRRYGTRVVGAQPDQWHLMGRDGSSVSSVCGSVTIFDMSITVTAWNVRQGGGDRALRIIDALETDITILGEWRATSPNRLAERLAAAGYEHQPANPDPGGGYAGLLVASKRPVDPGPSAISILETVTDSNILKSREPTGRSLELQGCASIVH